LTIHIDDGSGASRRYAENRLGGARRGAQRLSSGLRLPSAAHDPAGLGLSEALRSQIRSPSGAARNALEGLDLARVAEGALGEVSELMNRIRELAVQAGNGTLSSADRASIDDEVRGLVAEIDLIAEGTSFDGISLLDGSSAGVAVQDGIDADTATLPVLTDATTEALGLDAVDLTAERSRDVLLQDLDAALGTHRRVAGERALELLGG